MPRANRFYVPGCVWHITHRCHDRQFLLRFNRDRLRWRYWLRQARIRYGLVVLNYVATSNHVHLLVQDSGRREISRSMQLIAGRTAQEYNQRKSRKGAFWEDRYFATAIDTDQHLIRCLVYIDLNMVRAGVVKHPAQWVVCGFNEIHAPPQRYWAINSPALCHLTGIRDFQAFQRCHRQWVQSRLVDGDLKREPAWTESVAVGSEAYINKMKLDLGARASYRPVEMNSRETLMIKDANRIRRSFTIQIVRF